MKYLATSTMQVSSSMTIMPPEPIIEPASVSSSKSTGRSSMLCGDAAARRSARLHGLELLAVADAAADVVDDLAQRACPSALRRGRCSSILPDQREDLRALAALGADAREPVGAVVDDERHVGPGLDVVEIASACPAEPAGPGADVLRPRLADACPRSTRISARRLAADEGAGAAVDRRCRS